MSPADRHQQASFDALLRPHLDRLYRFAFRLAGSKHEAEDLFQDVLTKAFTRLDDLVEIDKPGPWLSRMMYNHFIDDRRRFARQRIVAVSESETGEGGIENVAGGVDTAADAVLADNIMHLDRALARLSDEHRLVVLLHDAEGYKLTEIQSITDIPVGTIKSRLHRARARLREILDNEGT